MQTNIQFQLLFDFLIKMHLLSKAKYFLLVVSLSYSCLGSDVQPQEFKSFSPDGPGDRHDYTVSMGRNFAQGHHEIDHSLIHHLLPHEEGSRGIFSAVGKLGRGLLPPHASWNSQLNSRNAKTVFVGASAPEEDPLMDVMARSELANSPWGHISKSAKKEQTFGGIVKRYVMATICIALKKWFNVSCIQIALYSKLLNHVAITEFTHKS